MVSNSIGLIMIVVSSTDYKYGINKLLRNAMPMYAYGVRVGVVHLYVCPHSSLVWYGIHIIG